MGYTDDPKDFRQSNYVNPTLSMQFQPIPAPFKDRSDSQRIIAGSQFTGSLPNADQGRFGDVTGPTRGGRWMWNEDVVMTRFEFRASGVEPGAGRTSDSGLYIVRKDGTEHRVLDLSGATTPAFGTLQYIWISDNLLIKQGEILRLRTFSATLEMEGRPTVSTSRVYL